MCEGDLLSDRLPLCQHWGCVAGVYLFFVLRLLTVLPRKNVMVLRMEAAYKCMCVCGRGVGMCVYVCVGV